MIPALVTSELTRFTQFISTAPVVWTGKSPSDWAANIDSHLAVLPGIPTVPLSRADLRALWLNPNVSTEVCVLSTFAWGGMRIGNGRRIWAERAHWLPLCDEVRSGMHTRRSAFDAFAVLQSAGKLPGMGAAYFTKILFFADPKADAYILDQWTARSTHVMTGQWRCPAVQVDYTSKKAAQSNPLALRVSVTNKVTASDYEAYCLLVEQVAQHVQLHPHQVEERMFSGGGKNPHPWRNHVMSAWSACSPAMYV